MFLNLDNELCDKMEIFKQKFKSNKQFFLIMIATNGVLPNLYADEIIAGQVVLEDLFKYDQKSG